MRAAGAPEGEQGTGRASPAPAPRVGADGPNPVVPRQVLGELENEGEPARRVGVQVQRWGLGVTKAGWDARERAERLGPLQVGRNSGAIWGGQCGIGVTNTSMEGWRTK